VPHHAEDYVHRIGRTGRAGRSGEAILFAANRERRLLRAIEKATGQRIEKLELPSAEQVTDKRIARFKERITETLATAELDLFRTLVADYQQEFGVPVIDVAAALGAMAQGKKPLEATHKGARAGDEQKDDRHAKPPRESRERSARTDKRSQQAPDMGMERFRIEVGHQHGVKPGNIVGAIANEAELDAEHIGRIEIHDDFSTVDLPEGMPKPLFRHLQNVWVAGQRLQISRLEESDEHPGRRRDRKPVGKGKPRQRSGKAGGKSPKRKKT
jgi:ATP-dependent RNA helicase DeaD